jgi:transcriptional regulator with XRE-family HTH domain
MRGWNQARLAQKLGLSEGAVSKWKSGEREPPLAMLVRIAIVLHVSTDWLLGMREAPAPFDERVLRRAAKVLREAGAVADELAAALPDD